MYAERQGCASVIFWLVQLLVASRKAGWAARGYGGWIKGINEAGRRWWGGREDGGGVARMDERRRGGGNDSQGPCRPRPTLSAWLRMKTEEQKDDDGPAIRGHSGTSWIQAGRRSRGTRLEWKDK